MVFKVADLSPKSIFGNKSATDGTKRDLNIGETPGFCGLIQGQIFGHILVRNEGMNVLLWLFFCDFHFS